MPFGKHAYRHALQPSSPPLFDHIWISEDSLTSTFRRFAHGQRRHESRVPGPLEARRRLAKRKNTALANVAGSGPMDDIACLFGKDGKQHLKWTDLKSQPETQESQAFPFRPPDIPVPFYNKNTVTKSYTRYSWPEKLSSTDSNVHGQCLDEYMETHWMTANIKTFVGLLGVNLCLEPAHSQRIFRRLLAHSLRTEAAITEAVAFLNDLTLNTRGSENYAIAVEHLVTQETNSPTWCAFLGAVNRALSLGLVSPSELCTIVRSLSPARVDVRRGPHPTAVVGYYRGMWEAIGRCDIFNHKHLHMSVVNAFLDALLKIGPHEDGLSLAKQIIVASHGRHSHRRFWVPKFIIQWLLLTKSNPGISGDYVNQLLGHFTRRVVTEYVVCVTESLVSSSGDKMALLERWRESLFRFQLIPDLVQSRTWYELRPCCEPGSSSVLDGYFSNFSKSHQVILRLWVLRNLSMAVADGQYWRWQTPDMAISYLFDFYYYMTRESGTDHFLTLLMKGIHELKIPPSGLLIAAVDLKTPKKNMSKNTRKYLQLLEGSEVTFAGLFKDTHAYNATNRYFPSNYEKLIAQVDITSPSFIEQSVSLAGAGDSESAWLLIRFLRSHTPLKTAISMAWRPIPDRSEMALVPWYPQDYPDPHTSLEVLNALAAAFSCSPKISPRRAFQLVHWLYRFMTQYRAPVKPPLVRAMYHAGVVRYRRAGLNVPPGRYDYIIGIVRQFEDPVVVRSIVGPPKFG